MRLRYLVLIFIASVIAACNGSQSDEFGVLPEGQWGGDHIMLNVRSVQSTIEYDCGHGTIDEPIEFNENGEFLVNGIHVFESGGPIREDDEPERHPAEYSGTVSRRVMTLTVTLTDTGTQIGTFSLELGNPGRLTKCL